MALVAACVLAGEIKRTAGYSQAFAVYGTLVRPYVETSQNRLNPRRIRLLHPISWCGIYITRLARRLLASQAVLRQFRPGTAKRA